MPWNTPITWQVNQLVTETDLNAQVRDNLAYLKERVDAPASASYMLNESADYTTSSTTFVDVDAVKLAFTITTRGNAVMIGFFGTVSATTTTESVAFFDVTMDGVRVGGDDGLALCARKSGSGGSLASDSVSFVMLLPTVSAGDHTFKLQWKISGATMALRAGAGTVGLDVHPQFWVREVS
jgi:hypothetical protein